MRRIFALLICLAVGSCSDDDKAIDIVNQELEYGAVIRTLSINNAEFNINDSNSIFSVDVEAQDKENGDLLESVDILVRFKDNTPAGGNFSTNEVLVQTIMVSDFTRIGQGLPRTTLSYSYSQLATAVEVPLAVIECKDQFLVRLIIRLTDGRSFTTGNASSIILAFDTFFSSPYCYTINVVEPINEDDFTGTYLYSSVLDGPLGATFGEPKLVEITKGHSNNVRVVPLKHIFSHPSNELPRNYEFSVVCDEMVFGKNQLSSVIAACGNTGAPILLGPGLENAPADLNDDSVFELWFVEGYLGWDGQCGFGTQPSRIRFTKQ
ncbi:MAG: hypothetical protein ABJM06_07225 [Gilvibacter sp.]